MSAKGVKEAATRMRLEFRTAAALTIMAMLGLASTACSQAASLKARMAYKQANTAYQTQDFKKAAELYEETIQNDPTQVQVYFYLGNSYDNLYKPGVTDNPANDALLAKAIQNYELAADKLSADKPDELITKKRSLQFLAAAYGADKMNDPAKAEPVLQRLIQLDPTDPSYYFQLAKIYEEAGVYDEAEKVLNMAKTAKPNDTSVYLELAGYYRRQGQFDNTMTALQQRAANEPNNPEAYYTISTFYWDEAYHDSRLKDAEKKEYLQKGMDAVENALQIKPEYVDALVYKGLLLRLQATIEKDPAKQQAANQAG